MTCQMMKSILILLATTLQADTKFCDYWSDEVTKPCYTKDVLIARAHSAHQLAVHKDTNTLYFCFDFGAGDLVAASFNMDTRKTKIIQGIKDVSAIATSPGSEEIVFGGSHGLYRYDPAHMALKRLAVKDLDIWWLVFKNEIYFIKFPEMQAYYYANRTVREMQELKNIKVRQFVFDTNDNIFFSNDSGLYLVKKPQHEIRLIKNFTGLLGIARDNIGMVYVCSDEGIFRYSTYLDNFKKIVNILGVSAVTFDKDNNLIYSDRSSIVRLLPINFEKLEEISIM